MGLRLDPASALPPDTAPLTGHHPDVLYAGLDAAGLRAIMETRRATHARDLADLTAERDAALAEATAATTRVGNLEAAQVRAVELLQASHTRERELFLTGATYYKAGLETQEAASRAELIFRFQADLAALRKSAAEQIAASLASEALSRERAGHESEIAALQAKIKEHERIIAALQVQSAAATAGQSRHVPIIGPQPLHPGIVLSTTAPLVSDAQPISPSSGAMAIDPRRASPTSLRPTSPPPPAHLDCASGDLSTSHSSPTTSALTPPPPTASGETEHPTRRPMRPLSPPGAGALSPTRAIAAAAAHDTTHREGRARLPVGPRRIQSVSPAPEHARLPAGSPTLASPPTAAAATAAVRATSPTPDGRSPTPAVVPAAIGAAVMPRFCGEAIAADIPETLDSVSIISNSNLTLVSFGMDPNVPAAVLTQLTAHLTARVARRSGTLVVGDTHGSIYLVISAYIQAGVLQFKNLAAQETLCTLMAQTTFRIEPTDIEGRLAAIAQLDRILADLTPGPCHGRFVQVLLLGDNFYDRDGYDELTTLGLVVLNGFIPTYFLTGNHDRDSLVNSLHILAEEYNELCNNILAFSRLPRVDTSAWLEPKLARQAEGRSGHELATLFRYARTRDTTLHSRLLLALSHCLGMARVFGCSENIFYSHTPVTLAVLTRYRDTVLAGRAITTFQEFATHANNAFATLFRPLIQLATERANLRMSPSTMTACFEALVAAQRFCESEEFLMVTWKSDHRTSPLRGCEVCITDPANQTVMRTYTGLNIAHIFGHEENRGDKLVIADGREVRHHLLRLSLDRPTGKPVAAADGSHREFCRGSRALAIDTLEFSGLDLIARPTAAAAAARV